MYNLHDYNTVDNCVSGVNEFHLMYENICDRNVVSVPESISSRSRDVRVEGVEWRNIKRMVSLLDLV